MQNRAFLCVRVVEMVVEKYFSFTSSPNFAFFSWYFFNITRNWARVMLE